MECKPILILDISAINQLADDSESDAVITALTSGFHVRLPFTCASEVIATTEPERREVLLNACRKLLGAGDCIESPQQVLRKLVHGFDSRLPFDWRKIDVSFPELQEKIALGPDFGDDKAAQVREVARKYEKAFASGLSKQKEEFDDLTAKGAAMPGSLPDFVVRLQNGKAFWNVAQSIYNRASKQPGRNTTIRIFYAACEPFRALMTGLSVPLYDRCVRPQSSTHPGPSLRTGRNDTFMAIYLPYCDEFVTDDGGQLDCFRQIVTAARLGVTVRAWREMRGELFLAGRSATN